MFKCIYKKQYSNLKQLKLSQINPFLIYKLKLHNMYLIGLADYYKHNAHIISSILDNLDVFLIIKRHLRLQKLYNRQPQRYVLMPIVNNNDDVIRNKTYFPNIHVEPVVIGVPIYP